MKSKTPQPDAISAGPVLMIGNDTGSERASLATKKHAVATAHMTPDNSPGNITVG